MEKNNDSLAATSKRLGRPAVSVQLGPVVRSFKGAIVIGLELVSVEINFLRLFSDSYTK